MKLFCIKICILVAGIEKSEDKCEINIRLRENWEHSKESAELQDTDIYFSSQTRTV